MDSDRITGAAKEAAGKVEGFAGRMVGDRATEAEGQAREAEGIVENFVGQARDTARQAVNATFDTVQEHSGSALLVAGLIGMALGYVLARGSQPPARRRYYIWD
jgi:uncharacterized protein YjbJ (UPF0337 family)